MNKNNITTKEETNIPSIFSFSHLMNTLSVLPNSLLKAVCFSGISEITSYASRNKDINWDKIENSIKYSTVSFAIRDTIKEFFSNSSSDVKYIAAISSGMIGGAAKYTLIYSDERTQDLHKYALLGAFNNSAYEFANLNKFDSNLSFLVIETSEKLILNFIETGKFIYTTKDILHYACETITKGALIMFIEEYPYTTAHNLATNSYNFIKNSLSKVSEIIIGETQSNDSSLEL
jgi:hypothetical protein